MATIKQDLALVRDHLELDGSTAAWLAARDALDRIAAELARRDLVEAALGSICSAHQTPCAGCLAAPMAEVQCLRAVNAALVAALEDALLCYIEEGSGTDMMARVALALAKEGR